MKSIIGEDLGCRWQQDWDTETKERHSYPVQPSVGVRGPSFRESRHVGGFLTRLRLGHCRLWARLLLVGKHPNGLCTRCRVPETMSHVLLDCGIYARERRKLYCCLAGIGVTTHSLR